MTLCDVDDEDGGSSAGLDGVLYFWRDQPLHKWLRNDIRLAMLSTISIL